MSFKTIKKIGINKYLVVVTGALLGFLVFYIMYGFGCLDPSRTDWLMNGGDLQQHFIGWEFYRLSDWSFPIGLAQSLDKFGYNIILINGYYIINQTNTINHT